MPRTDSERLDFWKIVRDKLEDAISKTGGQGVVEFKVRDRQFRYVDPFKGLKEIEQIISRLEAKTASGTKGIARNSIRIRRGTE